VRARQPSPQGGLGFAAPPGDLDPSIVRARQPSPQVRIIYSRGLRLSAPPRDSDPSTVRARQPSPPGGLGFGAPPGDLDPSIVRARQPSPPGGSGHDPIRASMQGGGRPQNSPFDGRASFERTAFSEVEQSHSQSHPYGGGFSVYPPRPQIRDARYQMPRGAPSNKR